LRYSLQKFSKDKKYSKYPIELKYTRRLEDRVNNIYELDAEKSIIREQVFKIYAEGFEI